MKNELGFPRDSLAARLFEEGYSFSFFQAVRLLHLLFPKRAPVGMVGPPQDEIVRLRSYVSLSFPPSQIYQILPPSVEHPQALLDATFFGLVGPSGILPRHYTEMILRLQREERGPERTALRDWLDMFNHRLLSHFYQAWEKYRFYLGYESSRLIGRDTDLFTHALYSLIGLGTPGLRDRLHVSYFDSRLRAPKRQRKLARVEDEVLLFYAGYLSNRSRNAASLEAMLTDYFDLPFHVKQFQGQWLVLPEENQSRLGEQNYTLEVDLVVGQRTWDMQSKVRIRVGPLNYDHFCLFMPERSPSSERKAFFLLVHLVRLYLGAELSFDIQLILNASSVPECELIERDDSGPQLGWNTWLVSQEVPENVADAVFEGDEVTWVNERERLAHVGMHG